VADYLKRVNQLKGFQTLLSTGTDEHGSKMMKAAEKEMITVKALCDMNSEIFKEMMKSASVSYDTFIRTTERSFNFYNSPS